MKTSNFDTPEVRDYFHQSEEGSKIFVFNYRPLENCKATIYVISGITGINHEREMDTIEGLSNGAYNVVVIHPRGTGYSDGERGDISDFSLFINDYYEIIRSRTKEGTDKTPILLFGHSMSCAILMAVAEKIPKIHGVIMVNPPFRLKKAEGMSPRFSDYIKYAWYSIFARHTPVVNMAGNPALIQNEEDRKEAELRANDNMLVNYFSIYMMTQAKKTMDQMLSLSRKAEYPLLLLYGMNDSIVDKKGCDLIFENWKSEEKQYHLIENGSHGSSTVRLSKHIINTWISKIISK